MSHQLRIHKRSKRITPREREVLNLVLLGLTNQAIASALGISHYTARDHVSALLRKCDVKSRAQLMAMHVVVPKRISVLAPVP